MKGVKHYKRNGTEHKGGTQKMTNGDFKFLMDKLKIVFDNIDNFKEEHYVVTYDITEYTSIGYYDNDEIHSKIKCKSTSYDGIRFE